MQWHIWAFRSVCPAPDLHYGPTQEASCPLIKVGVIGGKNKHNLLSLFVEPCSSSTSPVHLCKNCKQWFVSEFRRKKTERKNCAILVTKTSHAVLFGIYIITFTSNGLGNPIWRIVVGREMNRKRNLRKESERKE